MILTILIFLLILSILVFVHEAGHFFVAKWSGIKVEEFGFGLPPRAWGKKIGETIYSLNWLPFGGFVKLFGEDEAGSGKVTLRQAPQEDTVPTPEVAVDNSQNGASRAFFAKPLKNRIAVVVAGVCMNLVLAIFLFYIVLFANGFKTEILFPFGISNKFIGANQQNYTSVFIGEVAENSPAKQVGIAIGDRITAYDGTTVTTRDGLRDYINSMRGKEIAITLLSEDHTVRTIRVTPRVEEVPNQGALGVGFASSEISSAILSYQSPMQRIFSGVFHTYNVGIYSGKVFGSVIAQSFQEKDIEKVREGVAGPIGIGRIVGDILNIGGKKAVLGLFEFMALLSLNLAVVNILPFPALDGGRLLFLVIEGIIRRKVKPELERVVNTAGMAILLGLILLITYNDLLKIF